MCEANEIALKIAIIEDRDYNLNNYDKYRHSPLVDIYRKYNDEYIECHTFLSYDDYFGVNESEVAI